MCSDLSSPSGTPSTAATRLSHVGSDKITLSQAISLPDG